MTNNSTKEKVIENTLMLISRYGTTAVTMDTIAKECGISKRTIYELFSDKNNLVAETIAWDNARMMEKFAKISSNSNNPLSAMLLINDELHKKFMSLSSIFFIDLKKSPIFITQKYEKLMDENMANYKQVIINGQAQGIFRSDIDVDIIVYLYFKQMEDIKNAISNDPKYKIYELFQCAAECHLRSIVTAKGLQIMEDFKKENKEIR